MTAGRRADRTDRLISKASWPAPRPAVATPTTSRDDVLFWICIAIFVAAAVGYALASPGTYQDDDLDHYFMARAALHQPEFLLNPWGRPAFTLLYTLPAQFGLNGVRFFTIVVSSLAAWFTYRAARALGFRQAWATAPLVLAQPTFFILSFSALVEPLGALLVAMILDGHARRRNTQIGVAAGILPLARLELAPVSLAAAEILGARRAGKALVWIAVPLAAWAVTGGLVHGDPLWLFHVVTGATRPLTSSGPLQYVRNDIAVVGPVAFLGFFLGLAVLATPGPGPRPVLAAVVWAIVFAMLTALSWEKLHLGGSVGFLRHLIVAAPAVALLSLAGFEAITKEMGRARRAAFIALGIGMPVIVALFLSHVLRWDYYVDPGHDWSRLLGIIVPAAITVAGAARPGWLRRAKRFVVPVAVLAAAVFCFAVQRPLPVTGEQKAIRLVAEFIQKNGFYTGRSIMANHPWFYEMTGRDRWDRAATPYVTRQNVDRAARGTIVIWDSHYGDRLYGDISLQQLMDDPRYRRIVEAKAGDIFRVVAFERITA